MMCQACERGDHVLCGMQTWCSCACDPSDLSSLWHEEDEIGRGALCDEEDEDSDEELVECSDDCEMACQCFAMDDGLVGPHETAACYGGDV